MLFYELIVLSVQNFVFSPHIYEALFALTTRFHVSPLCQNSIAYVLSDTCKKAAELLGKKFANTPALPNCGTKKKTAQGKPCTVLTDTAALLL